MAKYCRTYGEPLNEFDFLKSILKPIDQSPVIIGPGDDCSVVDIGNNQCLVESTDCLIEDVHFRKKDFTPQELARKALLVNVSDIAAMGGAPQTIHLSLSVPKNQSKDWLAQFFSSIYQQCEKKQIQLLGGDLCQSPGPVFINIHISCFMESSKVKTRKGLSFDSIIFVSGYLGDSAAGFYCLENQIQHSSASHLISSHKIPPCETDKALWLADQECVLGMMDISDGLLSDLQRIPTGRTVIDLQKIPISNQALKLAVNKQIDPLQWALSGGEDYRLLGSCSKSNWNKLKMDYEQKFQSPLFEIGQTQASSERSVSYIKNGQPIQIDQQSFQHFE